MTTTRTIDDRKLTWVDAEELEDAQIRTRSPRVLLAEDDAEMRRLLCRCLQSDGYEVVEARDGYGLLRYLGFSHDGGSGVDVDLIISDIRMPGLTGLEVLAELRRSIWAVPVILITAFGDEQTFLEAERLGARILDKPFLLDDLRILIRESVASP